MPPQLTLQHFSLVLAEYGFSLNHWKCKFYCSRSLLLGNTRLHDQGFIIGMTTCQFLQPSLTKARNKFCFLKHLLRRRTPAVGRAKLMDKAVTNSLKWCLGAIPPKKHSLGLVNAAQAMLMGWMLRHAKAADETWVEYRRRSTRASRAVLCKAGLQR